MRFLLFHAIASPLTVHHDASEGCPSIRERTSTTVEAESKTLLELRGKAPKVPGRVEIVLDELG